MSLTNSLCWCDFFQPPSAFSKVREAVPKDYERQRMKDAKAEKVRQMKKDLSLPLETIKLFSEEDKKPLVMEWVSKF